MRIGSATVVVHIYLAQSLKEKRAVMQSVLKRARMKFNAAIAETGDHELWQRAEIGIVVIGGTSSHADSQLQEIVAFIERDPRLDVGTITTELL